MNPKDLVKSAIERVRINLVLSQKMFSAVKAIADEEGTSITAIIQRFIRLGVKLHTMQQADPTMQLITRSADQIETEIFIL